MPLSAAVPDVNRQFGHLDPLLLKMGPQNRNLVLDKLPELRQLLLLDVQAALDGDPATRSADEVILAYPGFKAI